MFNHLMNRYQEDNQGLMLVLDIEAASLKERKGEIFEISVRGINCAFSVNFIIKPALPLGWSARFTNESSCYEFLRKEQGADYFANLQDRGGVPHEIAGEFYSCLTELSDRHKKPLVIFCRGKDYDFPVLQNWLEVYGFPCPWHYRNTRDLPSLYALVPGFTPASGKHTAASDVNAEVDNINRIADHNPLLRYYFFGEHHG